MGSDGDVDGVMYVGETATFAIDEKRHEGICPRTESRKSPELQTFQVCLIYYDSQNFHVPSFYLVNFALSIYVSLLRDNVERLNRFWLNLVYMVHITHKDEFVVHNVEEEFVLMGSYRIGPLDVPWERFSGAVFH